MKPSMPNHNDEFESWRTSQPCATACIQVPTLERKAPDQKSRKLRLPNARNISLTPRSRLTSIGCRVDMDKCNNIGALLAPTFGNFPRREPLNAASEDR